MSYSEDGVKASREGSTPHLASEEVNRCCLTLINENLAGLSISLRNMEINIKRTRQGG
jgi:adenylyl- and sulfurtransferase ThiI